MPHAGGDEPLKIIEEMDKYKYAPRRWGNILNFLEAGKMRWYSEAKKSELVLD